MIFSIDVVGTGCECLPVLSLGVFLFKTVDVELVLELGY